MKTYTAIAEGRSIRAFDTQTGQQVGSAMIATLVESISVSNDVASVITRQGESRGRLMINFRLPSCNIINQMLLG